MAIAEAAEADLFVSIHVNSAGNPQAQGYEVFVRRQPSADSLALASAILVQFAKRWPLRRNRGVEQASFVVVKQPRPACLVECFFLSNRTERANAGYPRSARATGRSYRMGVRKFRYHRFEASASLGYVLASLHHAISLVLGRHFQKVPQPLFKDFRATPSHLDPPDSNSLVGRRKSLEMSPRLLVGF